MNHTSFCTQSPTPLHRQYASLTTTKTMTSFSLPSSWQRQSALFGSTSSPSTSSKRRQITDEALGSSLGYFAFLPQSDPRPPPTPSAPNTDAMPATETAERLDSTRPPETPEGCSESDQQERGTSSHTARLEREQAEATQGEFDWVRSGGILRDARGRRDKVRTEAIRTEIRRRDEEDGIMRTWNAYEERWRRLTRPGTGTDQHMAIRFRDIPWPQGSAADKEPGVGTVEELDVESMQRFFLATLRVRTNKMTRKELVRAAWLRWHPDKLVSVLARVVPEDVGLVQEGVGLVMVCLKALQGGC
ncbi:hypothetical protein BDN71DRAFT_1450803 [Pleurotus eryngii]|uniref:Uncharacterized protein n=1 Tax=Pleurotus eryngii TaxID=5323 RepID=A0A9P6DDN5_PLEER|nr:hypothetical protein BDN71DRAFT_1450803 [Pleurotus eryngii]